MSSCAFKSSEGTGGDDDVVSEADVRGVFFRLVLARPMTVNQIRRLFVSKAVDKQIRPLSDISH